MSTATLPATQEVTEFLSEARHRYDLGLLVDADDRLAAEQDNQFANASDAEKGQWDTDMRDKRRNAKRPVLQWNRIPTYVQQVVNDGRQNKPAIKIAAADGGRKETADFFQARIRHIEYESDADTAYDTARDQQVTSGRGFIRVSTEWVPGTFRQRICIERIENQFSVVFDPASKKYDRSDAEWCFVISQISKAQHERDYGKDSIVTRTDFAYIGRDNPAPGWIGCGPSGDLVQIAEYWVKKYKKRTLCLLGSTGLPVWKDELTPEQYKTFDDNGQIVSEREDDDAVICLYIINGAEILRPDGGTGQEYTEWLGSSIPIVPVWGREATVDGKRRTYSLIRNAKDPQRLVNLYVSNIAEQIAMMPKAPYEAPVGSIAQNHEKAWQNAGTDPLAVLYYVQWDSQNRQLNRPERVVNEPPIQALSIGLQQAIDGIKSAMGIFDQLGPRPSDASGIAIKRAQQQVSITNFHFPDNEARSRKRIGEILVELIPQIDKPGDRVPIRSEDGKTQVVPIGEEYKDPKTGQAVTHVLDDGDYGVTVSQGPSVQSQRQEIFERDTQLITAMPELMFIIGDQYFANDDSAGAEERSERMKKAIMQRSPGLIPEPGEGEPLPPQVQQQVMGLQKQLEDTKAFAQHLHQQAEAKIPEQEIKKYIVDEQEKTKRMIALANLDAQDARMELEESLGVVHKKVDQEHELRLKTIDHAHAAATQGADQEHEAEMTDEERAAQADESEATRQHAVEMADRGHQQTLEQAEQSAKLVPKPAGEKK